MTTQANIKINGFSTFLSDYMQPEQLSGLKVEDAESTAEALILAGGDYVEKSMLKSSQPLNITLNSGQLKLKDPAQYRALSKAGTIGSGATWTVGLEGTTYSLVVVNNPLKGVGNSGEDNEVTITFCGSGKR